MNPGSSPEKRAFRQGLKRQVEQIVKETHRPPITLARILDAFVDPGQLPPKSGSSLRVTAEDVAAGLASSGDEGKFWFVEGYSDPLGDDVPRP